MISGALLGAFCIACAVYAQPPGENEGGYHSRRGKHGEREERIKQCIDKLGLTDEQKAKLETQRAENKTKKRELRRSLKDKRSELRQELDKPDSDKAKIDSIVADMKELEGDLIELRVQKVLQMKAILSHEQFEKLRSFNHHEKGRGKKGGKRHRRHEE
jgi:Spy/CpxP family protein refolding chaperone